MNIELNRPFRKEQGKNRFRATYRVTDVPSPGCVQVAVTLGCRIQLEQEIKRHRVKYNDAVLEEISKELVKGYVDKGGRLDPECSREPSPDPIIIDYTDFDMLAEAAEALNDSEEDD